MLDTKFNESAKSYDFHVRIRPDKKYSVQIGTIKKDLAVFPTREEAVTYCNNYHKNQLSLYGNNETKKP